MSRVVSIWKLKILICIISNIYNKKTLYNKENKGLNMIWIVTLENNKIVEVVNSEIGDFISNNKVIRAELKQDG